MRTSACIVAGFAAGAVAGWVAARQWPRFALAVVALAALASEDAK